MSDREKILERIRKLLALASNNPNEHEAASAAERAQVLLAEYNLTLADVQQHDKKQVHKHDPEFEYDDTIRTLSRPWRRQLGNMVAMLYFCKYFYTFHYEYVPRTKRKCGYIRHDIHNFVGARHNIEVAKLIYQYLTGTIERLAKEGAAKQPVRDRTSYQTSFQHACATRLCIRIDKRIVAAKAGQVVVSSAPGTALALIDLYKQSEQKAEEFLKQQGTQLTTSKNRHVTYLNEAGYVEGRDAGDAIGIDAQIVADPKVKQIGSVAK